MPNTTTTFTRKGPGGQELKRVAHSAAEAVKLRFDGWTEVKPTAAAATESAQKPATTSTTTSTPK